MYVLRPTADQMEHAELIVRLIETLKTLPSENPSAELLFVEGDCRFVVDS
jgi:hypothetical protein